MSAIFSLPQQLLSRRRFLKTGLCGAAGLTLYASEFERHWIEVVRRDIQLRGLHSAFDGMTIAQLSDIHLDEFTEPFLLNDAIDQINRIRPDVVFLTGDFVSYQVLSQELTYKAAWQCAAALNKLECRQRFAILGNHDVMAGGPEITKALTANGITVLNNSYLPIERGGGRFWLAGLDDPVVGSPDPDLAIPASIRNRPAEPVVLMCHAPDYADDLLALPAGKSVGLMLSGHTHGGQVRLPLIGALHLPPGGKRYVEGWFQLGDLQLYVNRGLGSIGVPIRFDCRPEISRFTLRAA
jgi:uncharacterized protein